MESDVLYHCIHCDNQLVVDNEPSKFVCTACEFFLKLVYFEIACSVCRKQAPNAKEKFKNGLCGDCSKLGKPGKCFRCKQFRPYKRMTDLGPSCIVCERAQHKCELCEKYLHGRSRQSGMWRCNQCKSIIVCEKCGNKGPLGKHVDGEPICRKCKSHVYKAPERKCAKCGKTRQWHNRLPGGQGVCESCCAKPKERCGRCKKQKPVQKRTKRGPFCKACVNAIKRKAEKALGIVSKRKRIARCDFCDNEKCVATNKGGKIKCATCYSRDLRRKKRQEKLTKQNEANSVAE